MYSRRSLAIFTVLAATLGSSAVHAQGVLDRMKQKAKDKISGTSQPAANTTATPAANATPSASATAPTASPASGTPGFTRAYTSFDFVPGEKTLFADDFSSTPDGDFPPTLKLLAGQAVVNQKDGRPALLLTAGDYGTFTRLTPRIKQPNYLGTAWTLEFDTYGAIDEGAPKVLFTPAGDNPQIDFADYKATFTSPSGQSLEGKYPADIAYRAYHNRWHHIAIVYKAPQLKVYVDQYRVLYVPDTATTFKEVYLAGIGTPDLPVIYRDIRLASGGGMNFVGQKFTDAKIVTHGIAFDSDKATLRPASMGTLNQIKKVMDTDPSLKFEIDGHTDNTGDAAHNLQLSQERATAVKDQLVAMGVDSSRLTTRGVGDTQPLGPNTTPEDKANNRRVEFVKK